MLGHEHQGSPLSLVNNKCLCRIDEGSGWPLKIAGL